MLTLRRQNMLTGAIALLLLFSTITVGVKAAFGAFDGGYKIVGTFSAAGQGLLPGSDVKVRGVNIGAVRSIELVDGKAEVTLRIKDGERVPKNAFARIRAKTLFGEKFVDVDLSESDEQKGPFLKPGDHLDPARTEGGFELEQVLAEAYPLLKAIDPAELMTVISTLAEGGDDLGEAVNRSLVNGAKLSEVFADNVDNTREFLEDFAKLSDELADDADDLLALGDAANSALPVLNDREDQLIDLLQQTGRLSNDVADLLLDNKPFVDASLGDGSNTLQLLYDQRTQVVPLVTGLRLYIQTLSELIRINVGDGTLMAAVKGLLGGEVCAFLPCAGGPGNTALTALPSADSAADLPASIGAPAPSAADSSTGDLGDLLRRVLAPVIRVALKFGAFVVLCLIFTGYLAFTIGNLDFRDPLNREHYRLTATFDDVTGLLLNDNVKVAGVVVGKVSAVKTKDGKAVVEFQIDNEHDNIPKDSFAAIRWRNLIGQRYLYLYPGKSPEAFRDGDVVCPDPDVCKNVEVVDLGALFNRLGPIVGAIDPAQVNAFLETLTQALDGREDKVGQALDDLAVLAKGLATRDDAIQRLVTNLDTVAGTLNQRDAQIEAMLQNLITLSDSFGDNTATLDAALTELGAFGTDLNGVLSNNADELDRLLANLAKVTDTVEGRLPELDAFLAGFAEANAAIFRAGNRGEFLNQKIICAFIAPPASSEAGCPTGDPIQGLSTSAQLFTAPPTSGASAIASLLTRAVGG